MEYAPNDGKSMGDTSETIRKEPNKDEDDFTCCLGWSQN